MRRVIWALVLVLLSAPGVALAGPSDPGAAPGCVTVAVEDTVSFSAISTGTQTVTRNIPSGRVWVVTNVYAYFSGSGSPTLYVYQPTSYWVSKPAAVSGVDYIYQGEWPASGGSSVSLSAVGVSGTGSVFMRLSGWDCPGYTTATPTATAAAPATATPTATADPTATAAPTATAVPVGVSGDEIIGGLGYVLPGLGGVLALFVALVVMRRLGRLAVGGVLGLLLVSGWLVLASPVSAQTCFGSWDVQTVGGISYGSSNGCLSGASTMAEALAAPDDGKAICGASGASVYMWRSDATWLGWITFKATSGRTFFLNTGSAGNPTTSSFGSTSGTASGVWQQLNVTDRRAIGFDVNGSSSYCVDYAVIDSLLVTPTATPTLTPTITATPSPAPSLTPTAFATHNLWSGGRINDGLCSPSVSGSRLYSAGAQGVGSGHHWIVPGSVAYQGRVVRLDLELESSPPSPLYLSIAYGSGGSGETWSAPLASAAGSYRVHRSITWDIPVTDTVTFSVWNSGAEVWREFSASLLLLGDGSGSCPTAIPSPTVRPTLIPMTPTPFTVAAVATIVGVRTTALPTQCVAFALPTELFLSGSVPVSTPGASVAITGTSGVGYALCIEPVRVAAIGVGGIDLLPMLNVLASAGVALAVVAGFFSLRK